MYKLILIHESGVVVDEWTIDPDDPSPQKAKEPVSPETHALEDEFRETLGTKVSLFRSRKGRGRLVVHFYSEEELQTINDVIVGGG